MAHNLYIYVAFLLLSVIAIPHEGRTEERGFVSSRACGQCHVAIYKGWKNSMHANAVTDPIFYPIFLETSKETGGKSDASCLSCHAPTTRLTKDWQLKDSLTREGVTCDFCHSIRKVTVGARDPFVIAPGKDKWGPLRGVSSPAHPASYSELFKRSELCGGCHELVNERGVPIFETYSEWKKSPQAQEGKVCQTCHMPEITGLVVPPEVKQTNETYINSHEAAGGHFVEQLKKAVTINLENVVRSDSKVHVAVRLENVGSGHKVPTGLPTRKLVLRLQTSSEGIRLSSEERIFQKMVLNDKGEVITKDSDLFLRAARIKEDNRLEPRKPRVEHFTFLAPEGKPVEVEAYLYYLYQPRLIQETEMKVELGRERAVVR